MPMGVSSPSGRAEALQTVGALICHTGIQRSPQTFPRGLLFSGLVSCTPQQWIPFPDSARPGETRPLGPLCVRSLGRFALVQLCAPLCLLPAVTPRSPTHPFIDGRGAPAWVGFLAHVPASFWPTLAVE